MNYFPRKTEPRSMLGVDGRGKKNARAAGKKSEGDKVASRDRFVQINRVRQFAMTYKKRLFAKEISGSCEMRENDRRTERERKKERKRE